MIGRQQKLFAVAALALVGSAASPASAGLLVQYSATAAGPRTTLLSGASGSTLLTSGTPTVDGLTLNTFSVSSDSPGEGSFAELLNSALSVQNNTTSPVTVYFFLGDTDFTTPLAPPTANLSNAEGGSVARFSSGSSLSLTSCIDLANGQNTCPSGTYVTPTAASTVDLLGSFNDSTTAAVGSLVAPFSISQELVLTLGPGGKINFADSTLLTDAPAPVPEPAALTLLASGVLALSGLARAPRSAAAEPRARRRRIA